MHAITRFRSYPFNGKRVAEALATAISGPEGRYVCLIGVDSQQHVVGVLLAVLEKHIFSDLINASVMHYDVLPEARMGGYGVRLLKAFEQWSKNRDVTEINIGINSGDNFEKVGGFIKRMGYKKIGENYVK